MQNISVFLNSLTHAPGIYQMLDSSGRIIYVGKARDLKKRITSYFSNKSKDVKTSAMLKHVHDIQTIVTHSETEALLLESNLIKKYQPHYNILFRDDKSYPYILITHHRIPRIELYRGAKKTAGQYFGPYPSASAVRETVNLIEKLFRLRTCSDHFFANRSRPCLEYQIGRCSGPCAGQITEQEYLENVKLAVLFLEGKNQIIIDELTQKMNAATLHLEFELAAKYRDQIIQLRQIQEKQYVDVAAGDVDVIGFAEGAGFACIQLLMIRHGRMLGSSAYFPTVPNDSSPQEILASFISQHYLQKNVDVPRQIILPLSVPEQNWLAEGLRESCGHVVMLSSSVRGQRTKWLEIANNSAKQALSTYLLNKTNLKQRFQSLKKILNFMPKRIECIDISHSQGEATVGSLVVFNIDGPIKNDYRRFNITGVTPGDDVAAMRQVLERRYKKLESAVMPDILLIDGGKGQLNAAENVLSQFDIKNILLIGVAKGVARKPGLETLHFIDRPPLNLSPDLPALHLIQQIRDEAHRFAITGHRQRRDKKRRTSVLESIPGIGPSRRRELLKYFGGIQGLNRASLDELEKVPGMSHALAERVFSALH